MKDLSLWGRSFYFCAMKVFKLFPLLFMIVLSGCGRSTYKPADNLSDRAQEDFKWKIIRYAGRAPEGLTVAERFYPQYDTHYREQQKLHALDAYYEKKGTVYFLLSRKAPSLFEKRVAIGGIVRFDSDDNIQHYEEVFRTWKMTPDTLSVRALLLFDKMVNGESLEPYYTKNSKGIEYIEFPDDRTYFDAQQRVWKVR